MESILFRMVFLWNKFDDGSVWAVVRKLGQFDVSSFGRIEVVFCKGLRIRFLWVGDVC